MLFDGVYNCYNFWVNFIIKRDKKSLQVYSITIRTLKKLLDKFGLDSKNFDTFFLIKYETFYTRSTAALRIAKGLSGTLKILYVFLFLPGFLRDWIYNIIAKNRCQLFGKREACRIPDDDEIKKF
jgi:predicted DCC family thiol-disulfide oxidoreductase YuxK